MLGSTWGQARTVEIDRQANESLGISIVGTSTARPLGGRRRAVAVDADAESWSFFGRLLLVIAFGFGALAFFGLALTWLRRAAP